MEIKASVAEKLKEGSYTFVLYKKGEWVTSEKKGIAPILLLLKEKKELLKGAYVADKVIGRAAALLLKLGGISYLHAEVISQHAMEIIGESSIECDYSTLVPCIINRAGDGMCPMEEAVLDVTDPLIAYDLLVEKIKQLQSRVK